MDIINQFVDFIMSIIETIQQLVADIRAKNDEK